MRRLVSPLRRVLAIDAGSRSLALLLMESEFGRLRIVQQEAIDLQQEGLVAADETKAHLRARLEEWGSPPVALVLPQHLSTSQAFDLPPGPETEVQKLIEQETVKLSGVSESKIIYDFVRTETGASNRHQFWITLAREEDVRDRIAGLGLGAGELCDVTTTANALMTAYRNVSPKSSRAILVDVGAQSTVVVVLLAGRGVLATSFQMGGDFFTRALARQKNCSEPAAEAFKRGHDLFSGPQASSEFMTVVDGWIAELKRQLNEWFEHHPDIHLSLFELAASGGAFEQPGLLGYLKAKTGLKLALWAQSTAAEELCPARRFEVAFGAALQALGHSPQPASLLPGDFRTAWQRRLTTRRLEFASLVLVIICTLALALGTWHQLSLTSRKEKWLGKLKAGLESVQENNARAAELVAEYESFRPVFAGQQNTLDALKTLGLLQQSRSNQNFWYVLLADQQSYFSQPAGPISTNKPARTNLAPPAISFSTEGPASATSSTNISPAKPGFIAELCVPEAEEAARRRLSQLVSDLKQQRLFSKVDLLSDDLRRNLADPKVVIPERDFVLALDLAETELRQPLRLKSLTTPGSTRSSSKRGSRPPVPSSDTTDKPSQTQP